MNCDPTSYAFAFAKVLQLNSLAFVASRSRVARPVPASDYQERVRRTSMSTSIGQRETCDTVCGRRKVLCTKAVMVAAFGARHGPPCAKTWAPAPQKQAPGGLLKEWVGGFFLAICASFNLRPNGHSSNMYEPPHRN